jgi:exosortase
MSANIVVADLSQPIQQTGAGTLFTLWHRQSQATLWALAAVAVVLGLAYHQNFQTLIDTWRKDPNSSHGFLVIPVAVWILWHCLANPYELRLMHSLNNVKNIPTRGRDLIIVATVNNVLHIRMFNGDGKRIADTDETRLLEQSRPIEDLRKQLEGLWPPHELTKNDNARVIDAVTSLVGLTPGTILAPWWGWVILMAILTGRVVAYEWNNLWTENATILPAVACLTWTFGGWALLRRVWPAIAYLVFMLPLQDRINNLIALPLQSIATSGSCFLLQLSGSWAIQEGNVINLQTPHGTERLDVALACNGLRMLMTMAAVVVAILILVPLPTWKRIILLVSVVPIALLSNMFRIVGTGWCYYLMKDPGFKDWAHSVSGWLMMPLALVLVGLELAVLSWLVPDQDAPASDDEKIVLRMLTQS